ncbi:glycosyltransferase family 2 protein [Nitrosopumilus sp. K4]|uniref:glycosyltransferase family 2 protein n=1 Tax=Nitrosopumilus sp. K4 TaxID=2795383 RepID=UPI001BACB996|nr:glycosyltransferase family 2 protein [Nitrosopumilus sp. K4]QUC64519.1 glycosyltransferase family 2 protein [Nitrosopumilus sp. K4]
MKKSENSCVIVIAYNESKVIKNLIEEIKKYFSGPIIIVDDGSSDDTLEIISQTQKNISNIHLISHPINLGPFVAIHTGIKYALKLNCKYFINVDGDGQHPPQFIPKLLQPIYDDKADLVIGSRYLIDTGYQTSATRLIGIRGSSKAVSLFGRQKITDVTSGFRAYNLKCAKEMMKYYLTVNTVFEFTLRFSKSGYRIYEIAIPMKKREYGTSYLKSYRLLLYPFRIFFEIIKSFL